MIGRTGIVWTLTGALLLSSGLVAGADPATKPVTPPLPIPGPVIAPNPNTPPTSKPSLAKAAKRTFVYADAYDTAAYTAATGATDVCILGGGEMMMPGVGVETMFYKGLFDKLGVGADYVQIGEYKGAEEPYTRTAPSEELRGELNKLVDSLYNQIVDGIATHRNLPKDAVKAAIDEAILT